MKLRQHNSQLSSSVSIFCEFLDVKYSHGKIFPSRTFHFNKSDQCYLLELYVLIRC